MAPHLAEECWKIIGCNDIISQREWPQLIEKYIQEDTVLIVVQVNGKKRAVVSVEKGLDKKKILEQVKHDKLIDKYIEGKDVFKTIYVQDKILNLIIK